MIKVFTKDSNGKISFTEKELQALLDESYWQGYYANNHYVYTSPVTYWNPWQITCNADSTTTTYTLTTEVTKNDA